MIADEQQLLSPGVAQPSWSTIVLCSLGLELEKDLVGAARKLKALSQ